MANTLDERINRNLTLIRGDRSVIEISRITGIGQPYLTKLLRGQRRWNTDLILQAASRLGVDPVTLVGFGPLKEDVAGALIGTVGRWLRAVIGQDHRRAVWMAVNLETQLPQFRAWLARNRGTEAESGGPLNLEAVCGACGRRLGPMQEVNKDGVICACGKHYSPGTVSEVDSQIREVTKGSH